MLIIEEMTWFKTKAKKQAQISRNLQNLEFELKSGAPNPT